MTVDELIASLAQAFEDSFDAAPPHARQAARSAILAVLEGIREPTPAMKGFGGERLQAVTAGSYDLAHDVYTTMIDALRASVEKEDV